MLTTLKEKVDPRHTALIVIDMQNDFCAKGGLLDGEVNITMIQDMTSTLIKFIDIAREIGLNIIHVNGIYDTENDYYLSDVALENDKRNRRERYCKEGSWGAAYYSGFEPLPNEVVVTKHRYSAFIDTDLDLILRSKRIRTLVVTGVTTNVCVESTVRDGFMKDYYIVLPKDCTATYSEEVYNNTLETISLFFGEVVRSEEVLKCWYNKEL